MFFFYLTFLKSPIHIAAAANNADKCLEILLTDLNDPEAVNAVTKDRRTPLHLTAIQGKSTSYEQRHMII